MSAPDLDMARTTPLDEMAVPVHEAVSRRRAPARADRRLGWVILLVFCAAFTLHVGRGLNAPFGFLPVWSSNDAYNGATWSTGARALHESGPIDSKFGAAWSGAAGDYHYASHPPAIYSATALAQLVVHDDALAARLLVLLASLAAAALLFLLLCELRLAPVLAAVSVGVGLSVPMFLSYGTMLDTLMLGLPFAVGYLLLWQRSLNGRTNRLALACAAATVCLIAWEGVILVAATGFVMAVVRRDREHLTAVAAAGLGAALAVMVTGLWQFWVYEGLGEVLEKGGFRAGTAGFSLGDYLDSQLSYTRETFGVPAMVVLGIGLVAVIASRRFRPIGVAALGTSVAYAVAFRQGSFAHNYWNYWLVITFVLAVGAIASRLGRLRPRVWLALGAVLACVLGVYGFRAELDEQRSRTDGERYVRAHPALTHPAPGQRWVPVVSSSPEPSGSTAAWVFPQARFYLGVPLRYATMAEAASYARRHAGHWIVLNLSGVGGGELVRGRDALPRLH
jgi:hypothetical protein